MLEKPKFELYHAPVPLKMVRSQRPTKRTCACGCGFAVSGVLKHGSGGKFVRGHQHKPKEWWKQ